MITDINFSNMGLILSGAGAFILFSYFYRKDWFQGLKESILFFTILMTVRFFFYSPFVIPTGSMIPTLLIGDEILANRFIYGFSQFSFPWSIIPFKGKLPALKTPVVGEVVVFRPPAPNDIHQPFIKRLVATQGQTVQMIGGILHINGKPCQLREIKPRMSYDDRTKNKKLVRQYIETLPNGVEHVIQAFEPLGSNIFDNTKLITVPAGHYFFMGDNRNRSGDSRSWGPVPNRSITGRADFIAFSYDRTKPMWQWIISFRNRGLRKIDKQDEKID